MIDYVKLNKYLTKSEVEQLKNKIDFYSTINNATGEEVSMSSNGKRVLTHLLGWEKNMKIKLYPSGWLEVSGSLHKLFNDGKHNFNLFSKNDLIETVNGLRSALGINPWELKISGLEFGANITPPLDSKRIIDNALMYKGRAFESKFHSDEGRYKQVGLSEYMVKLYDKRLHYESQGYEVCKETLRFELNYNTMRRVNAYKVFYLEDLKENTHNLIEPLLNAWDNVLLFDPTIRQEEMILKYNNINYWTSLIEKNRRSYLYELKKLRYYTETTTFGIQAEVRDIMKETLDALV
ncbi:MAG: hypothetical protein CBC56_005735 [Flavobacteriales bacterium TMED96]|nr:MAG: hypothetical protein CBC56_005735 [Flavobacteriales bacterium TMED96]|tara:strand:+ start:353 stop:1231 length:879 start_codon:yes stop_codon:yes gene_type:complete